MDDNYARMEVNIDFYFSFYSCKTFQIFSESTCRRKPPFIVFLNDYMVFSKEILCLVIIRFKKFFREIQKGFNDFIFSK